MYCDEFYYKFNRLSMAITNGRIFEDYIIADPPWPLTDDEYQYINTNYTLAYFLTAEAIHEQLFCEAIEAAIESHWIKGELPTEEKDQLLDEYIDINILNSAIDKLYKERDYGEIILPEILAGESSLCSAAKKFIEVLVKYIDKAPISSKDYHELKDDDIYPIILRLYLPSIIFSFLITYVDGIKKITDIQYGNKPTQDEIRHFIQSILRLDIHTDVAESNVSELSQNADVCAAVYKYTMLYNAILRSYKKLYFPLAFIWYEKNVGTYQFYLTCSDYADIVNEISQLKSADKYGNVSIPRAILISNKLVTNMALSEGIKQLSLWFDVTSIIPCECNSIMEVETSRTSLSDVIDAVKDIIKKTKKKVVLEDVLNEHLDNDNFGIMMTFWTTFVNFTYYNDMWSKEGFIKDKPTYVYKCEKITSSIYELKDVKFDIWLVHSPPTCSWKFINTDYSSRFRRLCPGHFFEKENCKNDMPKVDVMQLDECIINVVKCHELYLDGRKIGKSTGILNLFDAEFQGVTVEYLKDITESYNHSMWVAEFKKLNKIETNIIDTFGINYFIRRRYLKSETAANNLAMKYANGYINFNDYSSIPESSSYKQMEDNIDSYMYYKCTECGGKFTGTFNEHSSCVSPNSREFYAVIEKRNQWKASDAERDTKIPMPTNITQVVDIVYAKSATEHEKQHHLADIYYPQEMSSDSYPVIVSIHGGGWFYGDKKLYSRYTKHLAEQGFAVVNFNYRLAPEYKYPCGFSDVCRLMDYISKNAEQYNLDLSRLYMVGDSAGAQLVSQYAVYATNSEYRKLFDGLNELDAPIPAKVALNCGVYELSDNDECVAWYLPEEMSEDIRRSTENILEYMNDKFPETFLMASVNDDLCSCSDIMKSKLEELEIPHTYEEYGHSDPSAGHVFHINIISDEATQCNSDEIKFFNKK